LPSDNELTKILGWPGYRVYRHEINEKNKTLKLWVRRKRGNRILRCSSCGRRVEDIHQAYEREVRDLPCFEFQTTVIIEGCVANLQFLRFVISAEMHKPLIIASPSRSTFASQCSIP